MADTAQTLPAMNAAAPIGRERIARAFGEAAAHYDTFALLQRDVAQTLCEMLPQQTPRVMLDLGCGTGYCATLMRQRFAEARLLALDLAVPMLRRTAELQQDAQLICADAAALPLAADSIDLVCSSLALQWCPEPAAVFNELGRVLRPGGRALLSTFGTQSLRELRAAWAVVDGHVHVNRFTSQSEVERAVKSSGLRCHVEQHLVQYWYPDLRALSRELKGIGAHNMNTMQRPGLTGRQAFARAERAFSAGRQGDKGIPVTYELLYLVLEACA